MLIKQKDSLEPAIHQLEAIIQRSDVPPRVLEQAQVELRTLKAGMHNENNAAYFINFDFAQRKSWAIIHDLRLEHQGYVAQIDHLLISRFLEFNVLESKSFSSGISITERGEFLTAYNGRYVAIESPIEQNRRHGTVLWKILQEGSFLPTRLGITLQPRIFSYVLISPQSVVKRPPNKLFNTDMVIKSDVLLKQIEDADEKAGTLEVAGQLAKMVTSETLGQIARKLVALHKPSSINYYERFGINPSASPNTVITQPAPVTEKPVAQPPSSVYYCFKCKKAISSRVAEFCFDNRNRFGGRAYCFDCQKSF